MERAADAAAFARSPAGRFVAGASWVHFCTPEGMFGVVFHGRPARDDVEHLVRSLRAELGEGIAPHASVIDARRVSGIEPGAFEVLRGYVKAHHAALRERVLRLALLRPPGMEGAVVAGFFQVVDSPYPTAVFERVGEAAEWLGASAALDDTLEGILSLATGAPPWLGALRARLEAAPGEAADVDEMARVLALSARTLQRRLQQAGTTLQREVLAARIRVAMRRMRDTDDALTVVALEAGFASLQNFSAAFKRETGETPSEWRAARATTR